jgi:hypothetical protein
MKTEKFNDPLKESRESLGQEGANPSIPATELNLSEKICEIKSYNKNGKETKDVRLPIIFKQDVKEFIKILKEEFKRNWDIDFKDSPLKQLTAHDEMCFKNCDCSEIICNWIDKLAGKELVE